MHLISVIRISTKVVEVVEVAEWAGDWKQIEAVMVLEVMTWIVGRPVWSHARRVLTNGDHQFGQPKINEQGLAEEFAHTNVDMPSLYELLTGDEEAHGISTAFSRTDSA